MKFLIDVNLPRKLAVWQGAAFHYVYDLDDEWSDSQIWNHAKKDNMVIVTKDSDFSYRILWANPPPRVVHVKIGNMKLKRLEFVMSSLWPQVEQLVVHSKLVLVFEDHVEAIG